MGRLKALNKVYNKRFSEIQCVIGVYNVIMIYAGIMLSPFSGKLLLAGITTSLLQVISILYKVAKGVYVILKRDYDTARKDLE